MSMGASTSTIVRKKVAVFSEPGAIGPLMNLVGVAQGLRELGHECVFLLEYLPCFRTSPYDQISTYVKACWETIVDTSKWSVRNGIDDVFSSIEPDLIVD